MNYKAGDWARDKKSGHPVRISGIRIPLGHFATEWVSPEERNKGTRRYLPQRGPPEIQAYDPILVEVCFFQSEDQLEPWTGPLPTDEFEDPVFRSENPR